jgi:hypothetical protein
MTKEQLAAEAQRIKENEALQEALAYMVAEANYDLVRADADDKIAILRLQQRVLVVDDFLARIEAIIRNGQPRKQAGIV